MNILDTDALSHHMKRNAIGLAIDARMRASAGPDSWITAISAFEMSDGAIALHKSLKKRRKDLIPGFDLIQEVVEYLGEWRGRIRSYDAVAEQIYRGFAPRLRQELGDDARIAAIALATARRSGRATWTTSNEYQGSPSTGLRLACASSDELGTRGQTPQPSHERAIQPRSRPAISVWRPFRACGGWLRIPGRYAGLRCFGPFGALSFRASGPVAIRREAPSPVASGFACDADLLRRVRTPMKRQRKRLPLADQIRKGLEEAIRHAKGEITLKTTTLELPDRPPEVGAAELTSLRSRERDVPGQRRPAAQRLDQDNPELGTGPAQAIAGGPEVDPGLSP